MNIVIVGCGKVGYTIAEQLSLESHDITVIDPDAAAVEHIMSSLDVIGICGNGASYDIQKEAGVDKADLLIAATSLDEVNMICCLLARKLGALHTIARVRNTEYHRQLHLLKNELGLSMVINPEQATAKEIASLISFPFAISAGTFAKGRASVVELRVSPESHLVGCSLADIHQKFKVNILICAVERDGQVYIPGGRFVIEGGDKIHVSGDQKKIAQFIQHLDIAKFNIKNVMLVGGGRISHYLAQILLGMGLAVTIIEKNHARCEVLCEEFPDALIVCGDGTDKDLLLEEGLNETDAFVALTDMDEENMIVSMYAGRSGVRKVIAKVNRDNYLDLLPSIAVDSFVSPKEITAQRILQYVRALKNAEGSNVRTVHRIVHDEAEIIEFVAGKKTMHLGKPLKDISLLKNTIIGAIIRDHNLIIPHGDDHIEEDDSVIVITTHKQFTDLNDIFA